MPGYRALVTCLSLTTCVHCLQYSDVEAPGISCPDEHLCAVQKKNVKSCDCSSACTRFPDNCCMDAPAETRSAVCLKFENHSKLGVAVVSSCSGDWNGSMQIKDSCKNIRPSTDPLNAAPVTSEADGVTYKNRFCAKCNNLDAEYLQAFQLKISCENGDDFTGELELSDLKYSKQEEKWGIYRVDSEGISNFEECQLRYNLPNELKNDVYVCGLEVISECAPG